MRNLVETPIAARPEEVFAVLSDFSTYPAWNPFTPEVKGQCAPGQLVDVFVQLDGAPFWMKRRVLSASLAEGFCWEGAAWYSFMAPGNRRIRCQPQPDGTTLLVDDERIDGIAFAFPGKLKTTIARQMGAFGAGLKAYVEAKVARQHG